MLCFSNETECTVDVNLEKALLCNGHLIFFIMKIRSVRGEIRLIQNENRSFVEKVLEYSEYVY